MSITSSIIARDDIQADGSRHIREEHTDHLGRVHVVNYTAAAGQNVSALMSARVSQIEAQLAEAEIEQFVANIDTGMDFVSIAPNYTTKEKVWKRLMQEYRRGRARQAINLLPLLKYLNTTYTDTQIRNALSISQAKLDAVRSRAVGLENLKTAIETDDALIEVE